MYHSIPSIVKYFTVVRNNLKGCQTDRSLVCGAHELADHPQYHPSTVLMIFTMHTLARRVVLIFYVDPKGPFFFWDGWRSLCIQVGSTGVNKFIYSCFSGNQGRGSS